MAIEDQIAALEQKVAELERASQERDADGDPTMAAVLADKQLPGLYKQLLDATKSAQAGGFTLAGTRYDAQGNPIVVQPEKGSYFTDSYGNRYYQGPNQTFPGSNEPAQPPIPVQVWQDPNADLKKQNTEADLAYRRALTANVGRVAPPAPQYPNVITHGTGAYKVDPYTGAVEKVYDFGATPPSEQDLWQRDFQGQQLEAQKSNWAQQYKNERDKLASSLGEWWSSQRLQAAPYVMNPDWNGTPPGWGANGPVAQLYKMSGSTYAPTVLPQIQFDPQQAWQAAQQATGG